MSRCYVKTQVGRLHNPDFDGRGSGAEKGLCVMPRLCIMRLSCVLFPV